MENLKNKGMEQQSQKFLRTRKFMMVLPLLVFPFVTLAFWAMGGGKLSENKKSFKQSELNAELPNANLKNETIDKLGYYEKATRDSLKLKEQIENDPYFQKNSDFEDTFSNSSTQNIIPSKQGDAVGTNSLTDSNEEKVYSKLKQINNLVNSNEEPIELRDSQNHSDKFSTKEPLVNTKDVNRLSQMIDNINQSSGGEDPEMKQMNSMLEKILDIQHPERITEKIKENSIQHKRQVYPVMVTDTQNYYFLSPEKLISKKDSDTNSLNPKLMNKFYSIYDKNMIYDYNQNAVQAVIYETQKAFSGSTIKLKLMDDVYINGMLIPKGNFIFGTGTINEDRLLILIKTILYKNNLLPVDLSVFDLDGIEGIYIPGSITNNVKKQTTNDAIQNIGLNSLNPTIGAQAISTGIEAGKSLLTRKTKATKITVKAGYHVLLKNNNSEQTNF